MFNQHPFGWDLPPGVTNRDIEGTNYDDESKDERRADDEEGIFEEQKENNDFAHDDEPRDRFDDNES